MRSTRTNVPSSARSVSSPRASASKRRSSGLASSGASIQRARSKMTLDPFQAEKADDVERLKAMQREVHEAFIALVKAAGGPAQGQRRGAVPGCLLVGTAGGRARPDRWPHRHSHEDAIALWREGQAQARVRREGMAPAAARPVAYGTCVVHRLVRPEPRRRCAIGDRGAGAVGEAGVVGVAAHRLLHRWRCADLAIAV